MNMVNNVPVLLTEITTPTKSTSAHGGWKEGSNKLVNFRAFLGKKICSSIFCETLKKNKHHQRTDIQIDTF